ncbi:hypothetical protein NQZ68_024786 [Dissostichus eleginoides]|nr:hypothetical protein NQZ68_024786 [Dissostichus eleginoides]
MLKGYHRAPSWILKSECAALTWNILTVLMFEPPEQRQLPAAGHRAPSAAAPLISDDFTHHGHLLCGQTSFSDRSRKRDRQGHGSGSGTLRGKGHRGHTHTDRPPQPAAGGVFHPRSFDVNVKAVLHVSQMVGRGMRARGSGGSIVNVSSQASQRALREHAVYCESRAVEHSPAGGRSIGEEFSHT